MRRLKLINSAKFTKWVSISTIVSSLVFSPSLAAFASTDTKSSSGHTQTATSIQKVYHVYINQKPIGTVDDPQIVSSQLKETESQFQSGDPSSDVMSRQAITLVSEDTFNPVCNNDVVKATLKKEIQVEPAAEEILIDGKSVAAVKDEKEAEQVLQKFETQFVSDKTAQSYLSGKFVSDQLSSLNVSDEIQTYQVPDTPSNQQGTATPGTGIQGVKFKQAIAFKKVPATSVKLLSVDEAVSRLTNGELVNDTYHVKSGDTLVSIAHKFNLKLDGLLSLNPKLKDTSTIHSGDPITVKKPQAYLDLEVKQTVTKNETVHYDKKVKKTDKLYVGQKKVTQRGHDGKKRVTYNEILINGESINKDVTQSQILLQPQEQVTEVGTKVISSRGTGQFEWPTVGGVITSPFGMRWGKLHKGIDIAGVSNHDIKAADNGVVTSAGWDNGGYGNRIVINHNNGFQTTYNHLSKIEVHAGQVVRKGQVIGIMGETGDATGVHLHFEVYKNGQLMNPLNFVHR